MITIVEETKVNPSSLHSKLDDAYLPTDMKLERWSVLWVGLILRNARTIKGAFHHGGLGIRQESEGGTLTDSTDANPTRTSLADLPDISAPAQIGMIMPNPDNKVYAGQHTLCIPSRIDFLMCVGLYRSPLYIRIRGPHTWPSRSPRRGSPPGNPPN